MTKKKLYRIKALLNTEWYGETPERATSNMMSQAETCETEDWTILEIEEIKETKTGAI